MNKLNKLFDPKQSRLTVFPIQYPEIWDFRTNRCLFFGLLMK